MNQAPHILYERSGAVFVESLVVIPVLWTFFLCIVQIALLAQADLLVRHAAQAAARSASVVLPDDPREYGGEPERSIARRRTIRADVEEALATLADGVGYGSTLGNPQASRAFANLGRSRLNTIRMAAHVPLMPLAPRSPLRRLSPKVRSALASSRSVAASLYYQTHAVAVTFPGTDDDQVVGPEVTVRVTYAYACTIPVARRIVCSDSERLGSIVELDDAALPVLRRFAGGRFRSIQHEATALVHDAPYEYRRGGLG